MKLQSKEEFIAKEIRIWGEDYIHSLIDTGYEPIALYNEMAEVKWSWRLQPLTSTSSYASIGHGGDLAFLPFRRESRLSDN